MTDNTAKQVLLIQNAGAIADRVQSSLLASGLFDLKWSQDLTSALNYLRTSWFDVVLLDLSLSDSTGIDALIAVRNQCPDTPIVVLGDSEDPDLGMRVLSEGAQDYVSTTKWNPASAWLGSCSLGWSAIMPAVAQLPPKLEDS